MRDFAKRLIVYETGKTKFADAKTSAAFHLCEKLRSALMTLMGNGGFRALLSRSLALANAEVLWLRAVHVRSDGSLVECSLNSELAASDAMCSLAHRMGRGLG